MKERLAKRADIPNPGERERISRTNLNRKTGVAGSVDVGAHLQQMGKNERRPERTEQGFIPASSVDELGWSAIPVEKRRDKIR